MPLAQPVGRVPSPEKRRLFNTIAMLLALTLAVLVGLQYSRYALLPRDKTSVLWGMLTGVVLMGVFIGVRWERAAQRTESTNAR
jgi:hypothetical protein